MFQNIWLVILVCLQFNNAYAGAWLRENNESEVSTSVFYAFPYTYYEEAVLEDEDGNITNYNIKNRIQYGGLGYVFERGYTENLTLIAAVDGFLYNDKLKVNTDNESFALSANYYNINPRIGARYKIKNSDLDVWSIEGLIFAGTIAFDDSTRGASYLHRNGAVSAAILYGRSFHTPFGLSTRPEYGSYFDVELGYKLYPANSHGEINLNAMVGFKPINDKISFGIGFYNTFNGFNYTKRMFDKNIINQQIDALQTVSEGNKITLKQVVAESLEDESNYLFNQVGLQVGYEITPQKTLYLKSFHSLFNGNAFRFNSIYLTLDYRY